MSKKKKGSTLLEVVISIAILAILIVPLSNMIITSIKINKKGEEKQKAKLMSQEIIEKIRSEGNIKKGNDLVYDGVKLSIEEEKKDAENNDEKQYCMNGTINDLNVDVKILKRDNVDNDDKYINEDLDFLIIISKDKIEYINNPKNKANITKLLKSKELIKTLDNSKEINITLCLNNKEFILNDRKLQLNQNGKIGIYIKEHRQQEYKAIINIKNLGDIKKDILFFKNKVYEGSNVEKNISEDSYFSIETLNLIEDINYIEEAKNKGLYTVNIRVDKNGQVLEETESEILIND